MDETLFPDKDRVGVGRDFELAVFTKKLRDANWAKAVTLDIGAGAGVGSVTADHAEPGGWRQPMGWLVTCAQRSDQ